MLQMMSNKGADPNFRLPRSAKYAYPTPWELVLAKLLTTLFANTVDPLDGRLNVLACAMVMINHGAKVNRHSCNRACSISGRENPCITEFSSNNGAYNALKRAEKGVSGSRTI
jgi:hypothetical protein